MTDTLRFPYRGATEVMRKSDAFHELFGDCHVFLTGTWQTRKGRQVSFTGFSGRVMGKGAGISAWVDDTIETVTPVCDAFFELYAERNPGDAPDARGEKA